MMFEGSGHKDGIADGRADAALSRPERARPNLTMAVISTGYRDAYIAAYHSGYRIQRAQEDRNAVEKLNRQDLSKRPDIDKADQLFEQGWKDGYAGKSEPSKSLNPDQRPAWDRGQKIGFRDRDFERARQLRQKTHHQSQTRSQGNRGR
jgi:hypothetical protein